MRRSSKSNFRTRGNRGARAIVAALATTMAVPLTFTAVDQLPAGAVNTWIDTPSPSPSATCATLQCYPNFYDFPVANSSATTTPGSALTINVLPHDCDSTLPGQTYNMSEYLTQPSGSAGSVAVGPSDTYVYTPAAGFTGSTTFSYEWELTSGYEVSPQPAPRFL
jgi:hypothetical protein